MIIDKPEHQKILLELINQANFPGNILELMVEVKKAIVDAKIGEQPKA
jgi:hypothetical protein